MPGVVQPNDAEAGRPTRAEQEKARRAGQDKTARERLRATVRTAVAADADLEAGEVDDRFQSPDCAHAGQGAGVEVGGVLVEHLAGEVGEAEIGGDERCLVVDGRCEPLVALLHRCVGKFDQAAHARGQGQAGRPESGDEREALDLGPCGSMGPPGVSENC